MRLTQVGASGATATFNEAVPTAGIELGMVFFDIQNTAVGDTFTLYIRKDNPQPTGGNTNANVIYGGLTFDLIPVPEPGTASWLLAGASLCARRPRRPGA